MSFLAVDSAHLAGKSEKLLRFVSKPSWKFPKAPWNLAGIAAFPAIANAVLDALAPLGVRNFDAS